VVLAWHRADGEVVHAGEPLVDVLCGGVALTYKAAVPGRLTIIARAGSRPGVGATMGRLESGPVGARAAGCPARMPEAAASSERWVFAARVPDAIAAPRRAAS
jgi:pyruvate/2-oxoglutarate dehydrogenase complex dihydrolipoamide acyltransferase (E2) component